MSKRHWNQREKEVRQDERQRLKEEIEKIFDIYEYSSLDLIEEKILALLEEKK